MIERDESVTEDSRTKKKVSGPEIPEAVYKNFEKLFGDQYRYFDYPSMLRKLKIPMQLWTEGMNLAKSGQFELESVDVRFFRRMGGVQSGVATGILHKKRRDVSVFVWFTQDTVTEMSCYDDDCMLSYFDSSEHWNNQICVHMAALIYLMGSYLYDHNPGDATDSGASRLVENFRKDYLQMYSRQERTAAENQLISAQPLLDLEPYVMLKNGTLQMMMRIGSGRKYKIKDLQEFCESVEQHQSMRFGSKTEFLLGDDRFSSRGLEYYRFLHRIIREYNAADESGADVSDVSASVPLYGAVLDDFYDILKGDSVEYKVYGGEKYKITPDTGDLHVKVLLQPVNSRSGVLQGVRMEGSCPLIFKGQRYAYRFGQHHLRRIGLDAVEAMQPLWDSLRRNGDLRSFNYVFGRQNLAVLMYDILPWMRRYAAVEVEGEEEIQECLPPLPEFTFYLDAPGQDVTCRAVSCYGEEQYDLLNIPSSDAVSESRDRERENRVLTELKQYFPQRTEDGSMLTCGGDSNTVYRFMSAGVERLMEIGEVNATARFQRVRIRKSTPVKLGVRLTEGHLLDLNVEGDMSREELTEILQQYQEKKRFYRLKDGSFINLNEEKFHRLNAIMESLQMSPKEFVEGNMQIPAYRTLYIEKMLEDAGDIEAERDHRFRELVKEFKTIDDADFAVPDTLKGVLRRYQKVGYRWLRTLDKYGFGGILADDMGLGKTVQVIAVLLAAKKEEQGHNVSLVVSPASLVYNWEAEIAKFAPELRSCTITGTSPERARKIRAANNYDVLITSYDLLKRDIAEYEDVRFRFEIIDEAQYIKNHMTSASKSVKIIHSRTRFALTGTPIENRLSELWSIFDYLMPGFLYRYDTFRSQFEKPIVLHHDDETMERLKNMVSPFILRRFKQDVLKDLPDKLEEVHYSYMEKEQKDLYQARVQQMRNRLLTQDAKEFQKNRFQIFAALTQIRQICCDPSLCYQNYKGGSAKREACVELIQSAAEQGHKVLVFSQFVSMLDLLEKDLEERKIPYFKIVGKTPKLERLELVERFNEGDTPVFLISLRAGGTGLNLTGADVVIHYDPWWNLAVQNQATDRAYRIGQKRKVTVYKLIMKNTIEERIMEMQDAKKQLAEDILNTEGTGSGVITRDDLLDLLEEDF
ncbi:MAG: DEAD/DEAH box helicase [Eubacterium sp.]